MQRDISTNMHIPEDIWKAVKVKAAQEGKSMKQLILEGLDLILNKEEKVAMKRDKKNVLLEFSGRIESPITDGAQNHDRYLSEK